MKKTNSVLTQKELADIRQFTLAYAVRLYSEQQNDLRSIITAAEIYEQYIVNGIIPPAQTGALQLP